MKLKAFSLTCMTAMLMTSCISNDLPYPRIVPTITSLSVEGAISTAIDSDQRTIDIVLAEATDPASVHISDVRYGEEITSSEPELKATHNLLSPLKITLHTYQDYAWTVRATRPVERYFTISGQVGASTVDDANRRVVAYVSGASDIENLTISSIKLGPKGITTYFPAIESIHDFSDEVPLDVMAEGRTERWYIYIEKTETVVEMGAVNPWTRCAWIEASGVAGNANGFRYRKAGAEDWTEATGVQEEGGAFKVCIKGLEPLTAYECKAYSGTDETAVFSFETEAEEQVPNAGFETFSHAESANFYSFYDPASLLEPLKGKWWDSGNVGSTTVGAAYAITVPDTQDYTEGHASVQLVSRNVVIKFAAGNIFSGEFAGLVGTQGGIVNFGRPFSLRPVSLRLKVKYICGATDCIVSYPDGQPVKIGDPDRGQIYVALGDWDYRKYGGTRNCPVQVNTTDKSTFFKADGEAVIAYGSVIFDKSTDGWTEIVIPLDYRTVSRKPTHIIISCASSMLGDYFTGSSESRMWIDDVRLEY